MSVFKSNTSIYVQLINDEIGQTLMSISSRSMTDKKNVNIEVAAQIGKKIAEKALESGIKTVVFDRNGYLYHGKVKALAESAREGGLKI